MRKIIILLFICQIAVAFAAPKSPQKSKRLPDSEPILLFCPKGEMPKISVRMEESGIVRVRVTVEVDGTVSEAKLDIPSDFRNLDNAAREQAMECKYKPAIAKGRPVQSFSWIVYNFVFDDPEQTKKDQEKYAKKLAAIQGGSTTSLNSSMPKESDNRSRRDSSGAQGEKFANLDGDKTSSPGQPTRLDKLNNAATPLQNAPLRKVDLPPGTQDKIIKFNGTAASNGCGAELEAIGAHAFDLCKQYGNNDCEDRRIYAHNQVEMTTMNVVEHVPYSDIQKRVESLSIFLKNSVRSKVLAVPVEICLLKARKVQLDNIASSRPTIDADADKIAARAIEATSKAIARNSDVMATDNSLTPISSTSKNRTKSTSLSIAGNDSMANRNGPRQQYLHDPLALANNCVALDFDNMLYGGFKNNCNKKVMYGYCAYHPKKGSWADAPFFDCEGDMAKKPPSVGGLVLAPLGRDSEHTNGAERIYWFACTNGAQPEELHWNGSNILGKCIHRYDH
ncbi:energy transducer TonB [Duganella vulcania]|uniref:TonB family protein n=1 Tax=Duganella vulcania TaxID=2692166 RepID=A0A845GCA8_9BURK|nr:energy transducer TonB [Duganella vulcania]MYM92243.1 TonB family protein [Duganella vulcania]